MKSPTKTITLAEAWRASAAHLRAAKISTPALDARLLAEHAAGASLAREGQKLLASASRARLKTLSGRRAAGEPVARLLGRREFYGLTFALTPAVLDPRPDSEVLVETALAHWPREQEGCALDLGTGSACLIAAFLRARRRATALAVDCSSAALAVARHNARALGLAGRVQFRRSDWFSHVSGRYRLVLANPPYIAASAWSSLAREVAVHEPWISLYGGKDGLAAARRILRSAARYLTKDGFLLMEMGAGQKTKLTALARRHGLRAAGFARDLAGHARVLILSGEVGKPPRMCVKNNH